MKKEKTCIIRYLSGIELLIRKVMITEPVGETLDLSYGNGPRVMRTVEPKEQADFNSWANHVHKEILSKYK